MAVNFKEVCVIMPNNQQQGDKSQKHGSQGGQGGMHSPGKSGTQKPGQSQQGQSQKDKDKMGGQSGSQQGSEGNKPSY
jgi:hypothetical protein